jgi:ATP-dependent Clp protease ATP-binding subunit ClpA
MSEYQELESMDRFIGSLRLNEPGQFTTMARDNPFALILLDELEKANKNILNIFLQVFDEANLTDAFGRKVSFEQHIIIATSNAGADVIRDLVREGVDPSLEKEKIMDVLIKGNYFRPEFLNRFDEIVVFYPLTEEQVYKVSEMAVNALAKRMLEQDYIFKPTPEIIELVAKAGFDPQFGARPIQRAVKDKLENAIAKKILDGAIQKGQEFSLTAGDIE